MKNISLLLLLFLISCSHKGEVKVLDASKDTTIMIKTTAGHPVMMNLEIKGQTNDSFKIRHIILPGGSVDTKMQLDWYHKDFLLEYKSYKATKGSLTIKYNL
jgi:hypothetical protein